MICCVLQQVLKSCKGLPSHIYQAAERIKEIVAKGHNVEAQLREWFHEYFDVPGMPRCPNMRQVCSCETYAWAGVAMLCGGCNAHRVFVV